MAMTGGTVMEVDIEIRFNSNKVWMQRSMSLENRGGRNYLKLRAKTNDTSCSTVTQYIDVGQVTAIRPVCTHIRPDIMELVRQKPTPLPTIAVSLPDRNAARLWKHALESVIIPGGIKGEPERGKSTDSTSDQVRGRHVSQVSHSSSKTDDTNPYETIDDYIAEERSLPGTPPPIPKKRLYQNELKLEILYDSVNNLIRQIKELEQRERDVTERIPLQAAEWTAAAMKTTELAVCSTDELLIDIGGGRQEEADIEPYGYSRPMPDYPAPRTPTGNIPDEFYLAPDTRQTEREPEYAQIRKNHVKISWT